MVDFSAIVNNLQSSAGVRPMTKTASGRYHYDWVAGEGGLRIGTIVRVGSGTHAGMTGKITQPFPGCRGDGDDWYGIFLDNDREANIRHTDIVEVKTASGWEPISHNQRTATESIAEDLRKAADPTVNNYHNRDERQDDLQGTVITIDDMFEDIIGSLNNSSDSFRGSEAPRDEQRLQEISVLLQSIGKSVAVLADKFWV